jgi:hypothetical protein
MWRPKPKKDVPYKALVVEASYVALTCRIDDNVIFWGPGKATAKVLIPPLVKYLWLAPDILADIRKNLLNQAIIRNIEIWPDNILALRERLFSVWADDRNRSMIYPADPGFDSLEEAADAIETPREAFLRQRRELLLEAAENSRFKRAESEGIGSPTKRTIDTLPIFDQKVYEAYFRHLGKDGKVISRIAAEFGIPEINIQKTLDRVRSVLA